jgi:signal transduction histidine kinase
MMEVALDRAEEVLIEGRERVADLRSNEDGSSTLLTELKDLASGLDRYGSAPVSFECTGTPRPLRPVVKREILAIAKEGLTNACRHSRASTIFCHLTFTNASLLLVCEDNGIGIERETIELGRREGHWGLIGMHERARNIGGVLQIRSVAGQTRIELSVNTRMAYFRQIGRRLLFWATP